MLARAYINIHSVVISVASMNTDKRHTTLLRVGVRYREGTNYSPSFPQKDPHNTFFLNPVNCMSLKKKILLSHKFYYRIYNVRVFFAQRTCFLKFFVDHHLILCLFEFVNEVPFREFLDLRYDWSIRGPSLPQVADQQNWVILLHSCPNEVIHGQWLNIYLHVYIGRQHQIWKLKEYFLINVHV